MSKEICDELSNGLLGNAMGFLKNNAALMNLGPEKYPSSPFRKFDFNKSNATQSNGSIYAPTVDNAEIINGALDTWYLPWGENSGYYVIMEPDTGPDLMFTATLDGCAVGYIRAGDGAVRVSHHNIQGRSGTDHTAQKSSLSFVTSAFHKTAYYAKSQKDSGEFRVSKGSVGLIYGVRTNRKWRMYAQVVNIATKISFNTGKFASNYKIASVKEF